MRMRGLFHFFMAFSQFSPALMRAGNARTPSDNRSGPQVRQDRPSCHKNITGNSEANLMAFTDFYRTEIPPYPPYLRGHQGGAVACLASLPPDAFAGSAAPQRAISGVWFSFAIWIENARMFGLVSRSQRYWTSKA